MREPIDGRPVMADEAERTQLAKLERFLARAEDGNLSIASADGSLVQLTDMVAQLLTRLVHSLAKGQAVRTVIYRQELMIFEAADFLGEPASAIEQLIESGELSLVRNETHRRILLDDAMAYRIKRDAERRQALRELTELNQELGLYSTR